MLAAFSITPLGVGDSVGDGVADAVRLVRQSGLAHETNAMFTNVEGEWDEVMALVKECVETVAEEAPRVSVVVKIDYRPGHDNMIRSKVERIEKALGGEAPTGEAPTGEAPTGEAPTGEATAPDG